MKGKKTWILSLTLAIAFCSLAFAGCGDKDDSSKSSQPNKDWADTNEGNDDWTDRSDGWTDNY